MKKKIKGSEFMSDSIITKKALALGLKELLKKKSFDNVIVSDITAICGLNRQTFYYHFHDKYELVNWIYYNEALKIVTTELTFETWDEKVLELLNIMKNEDYFYQSTLRNTDSNEFHNYLFSVLKELFTDIIEHLSSADDASWNDKAYIAEFISYGVVGMIVAWAKNGMKQPPIEISKHLKAILNDSKFFDLPKYFHNLN